MFSGAITECRFIWNPYYLSIYQSMYPSIYPSVGLSVYLPIDRSIYLSICLSIYLPIYMHTKIGGLLKGMTHPHTIIPKAKALTLQRGVEPGMAILTAAAGRSDCTQGYGGFSKLGTLLGPVLFLRQGRRTILGTQKRDPSFRERPI